MLRHLCDEEINVFPEKKFQPAVQKLATELLLSGKAASNRRLQHNQHHHQRQWLRSFHDH